jgi:alkylresorcinol/alkylpyrone synthase
MNGVSILSLATAVPEHVVEQREVAAVAHAVFPGFFEKHPGMAGIFDNSGIERRRTAMPMDWYLQPRDWAARSAAYLEQGLKLYARVAADAIARAAIDPGSIDVVVTISSSGVATPSLESRLLATLGLRPGIRRVPVFGLGCAGGVSGLALAAQLAATPGVTVLVVVLELCSLAFRADRSVKEDIVAAALFGDGAAALVLGSGVSGAIAQIVRSAEHTWPDTLDVMGWTFDPVGFGVVLSSSVPAFVERELPPVAARLLAACGAEPGQVARYVCHPGGGRVVDALEKALAMPRGALDHERAVLREFGNMSAPTVLFALERVLAARPRGLLAVSALGPGFTASLVTLQTAHA